MNIWIFNHYATDMFLDGTGRHQSFGKYLIRKGHKAKIFCANTVHNSDVQIDTEGKTYIEKTGKDDVPYVFIKTSAYKGNGVSRITNMIEYFCKIFSVSKECKKTDFKPDVILASSVHPLTLVAGIKIAHRMNIPCVCEIRDIWPITLIEFGKLKKNSLLHKVLLKLELWTYKNADRVLFTMEGGREYISDMGWSECVPKEKIEYINNGVDIEEFEYNKRNYVYEDEYLTDGYKAFVYAGSVGIANRVDNIIGVARKCKEDKLSDVRFLIFGDGGERERLEKFAQDEQLDNVIFRGRVDKKYIPSIVTRSYANLIFIEKLNLYKYGMSLNKSFDYLAAGRPIIMDYDFGYNYIKRGDCGYIDGDVYNSIKQLCNLNDDGYIQVCANALKTSCYFSFDKLSDSLIRILECVCKKDSSK